MGREKWRNKREKLKGEGIMGDRKEKMKGERRDKNEKERERRMKAKGERRKKYRKYRQGLQVTLIIRRPAQGDKRLLKT